MSSFFGYSNFLETEIGDELNRVEIVEDDIIANKSEYDNKIAIVDTKNATQDGRLDTLEGKLDNIENNITVIVNEELITQIAQTVFDNIKTTLEDKNSTLSQQIDTKVTETVQVAFDAQQTAEINSKLDQNVYDTKIAQLEAKQPIYNSINGTWENRFLAVEEFIQTTLTGLPMEYNQVIYSYKAARQSLTDTTNYPMFTVTDKDASGVDSWDLTIQLSDYSYNVLNGDIIINIGSTTYTLVKSDFDSTNKSHIITIPNSRSGDTWTLGFPFTITYRNLVLENIYTLSVTESIFSMFGVVPVAPIVSYESSYQVYTDTTISDIYPTVTAGSSITWSISPPLPQGLTFNISTGVISGTPEIYSNSTTYTVTVSNQVGTYITTFDLEVIENNVIKMWVQRGLDIDGETAGDTFGTSVSLSSDGTVMAMGADRNDGNGTDSGSIRVYKWNGTSWNKLGQDIDGKASTDGLGITVSLNSDGTVLAGGAFFGDSTFNNSGYVRVYTWNGTSWVQRGSDINGIGVDNYFGVGLCLNNDGTILAGGGYGNDGNGVDSGYTRVYEWNGTAWTQKGSTIFGAAAGDQSGGCVSLNGNGSILGIGSPQNDGNGTDSGQVRIYEWNGSDWIQKGSSIFGATGDQAGNRYGISFNNNGNIVAIGSNQNDTNGSNSGQVRVYEWNGTSWIQKGQNINGETAGDQSGFSVSMNDSGDILAIGAFFNDGNGTDSGHVRVYEWNGVDWIKRGLDIDGEAAGDWNGWSLSLNGDGNIIAVGGRFNDGSGTDSGHVRVYEYKNTPNKLIVSVGEGLNTLSYSTNGGTTFYNLGSSIFSSQGYGIANNGSRWVATGSGTANTLAYSNDGINWIGLGTSIFSIGRRVKTNGSMWVATGSGTPNTLAYSNDGINWTGLGTTIIPTHCRGIEWNGNMWVAVGDTKAAYSYDGINWTSVNISLSAGNIDVAWNGSVWVITGTGIPAFLYSYDGINWNSTGTGIFSYGFSIASNGSRFVAVGSGGSHSIAYSDDGINWNGLGLSLFSIGRGISWVGDRWIAGGDGTTHTLAYSFDGITWVGMGKNIYTARGMGFSTLDRSTSINFNSLTIPLSNSNNITLIPTIVASPGTTCTISPALPDGISINPYNGVISGTSVMSLPSTNYTVTFTKGSNVRNTTLNLSITDLFNPLSISNSKIWVDATDNTTYTSVNNSISSWKNKSSTSSFTGTATVTQSALNGLPLITVPTDGELTLNSSLSLTNSQRTVFIVQKLEGSNYKYYQIVDLSSIVVQWMPNVGLYYSNFPNSSHLFSLDVAPMFNTSSILTCTNVTGDHGIYVNGTLRTSSANISFTSATSTTFKLGYPTGSRKFDVGEILVYDTPLTTIQRQRVEGYLAWKWGLQSNLPSNHPYKDEKPMNLYTQRLQRSLTAGDYFFTKNVKVDSKGYIYTIGLTMQDTISGISSSILPQRVDKGTYNYDCLLLKFDPSMQVVMAKRIGSSNWFDITNDITIDSNDNVYITGTINGPNTYTDLTSVMSSKPSSDFGIYLVKYNSNGVPQWGKWIDSVAADTSSYIKHTSDGSVYIYGNTSSTIVDTTIQTLLGTKPSNRQDGYVIKYSSNGTPVWGRWIGGSGDVYSTGINIDSNGNIYLIGYATGSLTVDSNLLPSKPTAEGNNDGFILKLNSSHTIEWGKWLATSASDNPTSIAIDSSNDIYVLCRTTGSPATVLDTSISSLISNRSVANSDWFVKFDSNGVPQLGNIINGIYSFDTWTTYGAISVDGAKNIYVGAINSSNGTTSTDLTVFGTTNTSNRGYLVIYNSAGKARQVIYNSGGTQNFSFTVNKNNIYTYDTMGSTATLTKYSV